MLKMMITLLGIVSIILITACQRPYLNPKKESGISPVYTGGFNYKRQNFLDVTLSPPFRLIDDLGMRGQSTSTPCLIGDNLYITTYDGYLCKISGKDLDETANFQISDGISAAPTYFDRFLFIASENGKWGLTVYDILDAKIVWDKIKMYSSSAPVVAMDMVFHASHDGFVRAFNLKKGEEIWSFDAGSKIVTDLIFANSSLYITTQSGNVYNVDASSGTKIWEKHTGRTINATPALSVNGMLIITAYEGDLIWINSRSGDIIMDKNLETHLYNSPSVDENFVYFSLSNGRVLALNLQSKKTEWETLVQGPCSAPLLVTRDYLFAGTTRRLMYCLDKRSGKIVQEFQLQGRPRSTPVVLDGKLIFGTEYARFSALIPDGGNPR